MVLVVRRRLASSPVQNWCLEGQVFTFPVGTGETPIDLLMALRAKGIQVRGPVQHYIETGLGPLISEPGQVRTRLVSHDVTHVQQNTVLTQFKRLKVARPTFEDALRFLSLFPGELCKGPVAFVCEPWRMRDGTEQLLLAERAGNQSILTHWVHHYPLPKTARFLSRLDAT